MSGRDRRVRIAVLGAGLIGRRHVDHILATEDAAVAAIVDPAASSQAFAQRVDVPWFSDLKSLLYADRPDGVIVATPNQSHVELGLQVIAAGMPCLVEKPLADKIDAAERLVSAAERAGVPLLTGHHRRHNPIIQRAKEIIASGRLGRVVSVHAFFWLMKPDDYFDAAWRRERGGGPLLINMIHDVDLLRYLCGDIEAVQALQANFVRGFPVDETTVVSMRFANGALGTVNISDTVVAPWSWEHTAGENPVYPRTDQTCYFISGTHGALSVPRLELWQNGGARGWWEPFVVERVIAADADPLRRQIAQFCRVIRGEEAPLVSGREGLMTLKVIEAIQRAADKGGLMTLT